MDRNVFFARRAMLLAIAKEPKPEGTQSSNPNPDPNKYNPDVMNKFNVANEKSELKPVFVDSYYKTITNLPVKTDIKDVSELRLQSDKPDLQKLKDDYNETFRIREMERVHAEKTVKEHGLKMEQKECNQSKQFDGLKTSYKQHSEIENARMTLQKNNCTDILKMAEKI